MMEVEVPRTYLLADLHSCMRDCRLCLEAGYEIFPRAIFSGGMGVGLVFWGVAEPILHLSSPPLGIGTPGSVDAAQAGMRYSFFQ